MKTLAFVLILTVLLLSACGGIVISSGKMATQDFDVRDFDQIRLSTSGVLYIEQDDVFSLSVTTDRNILPLLKTEVEKGVLTIRTEPAAVMMNYETIIYRVTMPELSAIDLSGSADVRVEGFKAGMLHINLSGSGDITFINLDVKSLSSRISGSGNVTVENLTAETVRTEVNGSGEIRLVGKAGSHEIKISGSGDVLTENLQVSGAQVIVNGSGDVTVWAQDNLDVNISGSGSVQYFGLPKLTEAIGGTGDLVSLGAK